MSKQTSKKAKQDGPEPLIPLQLKLRDELRAKLKKIAATNGLSLNDVGSMCIAAGVPMVEAKLSEIHNPEPHLKAA